MKEKTKLIIARHILLLEKQMGHIEQDSWNSALSERERKGLSVELDEVQLSISEARKCFFWVDNIIEE